MLILEKDGVFILETENTARRAVICKNSLSALEHMGQTAAVPAQVGRLRPELFAAAPADRHLYLLQHSLT
jgi:hypothetical protein